ncbi:MAG: hypothetical protein ACKPAD_07265, partial [Bacteroidota bacterium]
MFTVAYTTIPVLSVDGLMPLTVMGEYTPFGLLSGIAYVLLFEKVVCTTVVGGLVTVAFKETVSPEQITESVTDAVTGICSSVTD